MIVEGRRVVGVVAGRMIDGLKARVMRLETQLETSQWLLGVTFPVVVKPSWPCFGLRVEGQSMPIGDM